ncbi:MAG TPA: cytochrome P450 [Candidatus Binataceae bacterium]|jgi:cytochrome P450|nr:cytochrome P450 [Candidatus Binataceae bacterium]
MSEAGEIYFNPWDEAFRANPYPYYRPLFQGPPRLLNVFVPMALVARYADCSAILRDHEHFSSVPPRSPLIEERISVFGNAPRVVFSDPPIHTRLRRLVSRAFTPRRIRELEPKIREFTNSLLNRAAARGGLDVMADLANPLPVMVIAHMLGVPPEHYPMFKRWSDTVIESDNTPPGMPLPQEVREAFAALRAYFVAEIEKRRRSPGDDLVSVLVAAHEDSEETLSEEELIAFVVILLLAGNETTTNLIGNGMLALTRHPGELERLRREPGLAASAVEEMLRYDGPVQSTVRHIRQDTEFAGMTIPAGTMIFVLVAAANRDPAQFPEPERFDIARSPNDHLAFGEGIHFCLGAPLARMEGAIAISSLLERFKRIRPATPEAPLRYKGSFFLRGLTSLPLEVG